MSSRERSLPPYEPRSGYGRDPMRGQPAFEAPFAPFDYQRVDLRAMLLPFLRLWWVIALAALIPAVLVYVYLSSKEPVYTAASQILLKPTQLNLGDIPDLVQALPVREDDIWSEVEILTSQPVLARVASALRGYRVAMISEAAEQGALAPSSPTSGLSVASPPSDDPAFEADMRFAQEVDDLRRAIEIKRRPDSYIVDVEVTAADRKWAVFVANRIADAYLARQVEAKVELADQALLGIREEVAFLRSRLSNSFDEVTLAQNQAAQGTVFTRSAADQRVSQISEELTALRSQIDRTEARAEGLRTIVDRPNAVETLPPDLIDGRIAALRDQVVRVSAEYAAASTQFGPNHPNIKALVRQIGVARSSLRQASLSQLEVLENEIETLRATETVLLDTIVEARNDLLTSEIAEMQVGQVEIETDALRQVYTQVLERQSEIETQRDLAAPDSTLLAYASVPLEPSGLPTLAVSGAAGLFFAMLAFGGIGVREFFRNQYADLRHLETTEDVSVLAALPYARLTDEARREEWLVAARYVNLALLDDSLHAEKRRERMVVAVTSLSELAPAEGVAKLLAGCAPEFGHSALVVDLNPSAHPGHRRQRSAPAVAGDPKHSKKPLVQTAQRFLRSAPAPAVETLPPVLGPGTLRHMSAGPAESLDLVRRMSQAGAPLGDDPLKEGDASIVFVGLPQQRGQVIATFWRRAADLVLVVVDEHDLDKTALRACFDDLRSAGAEAKLLPQRD